jgi:ABC-type iron transport system FetAB permease component
MSLFFIGALEMVIVTFWTKWVTENKILASGSITVLNVLIWYYVLETIVSDIKNWQLVLLYALGCSCGTMFCTYLFKDKENRANATNGLLESKDSLATR